MFYLTYLAATWAARVRQPVVVAPGLALGTGLVVTVTSRTQRWCVHVNEATTECCAMGPRGGRGWPGRQRDHRRGRALSHVAIVGHLR